MSERFFYIKRYTNRVVSGVPITNGDDNISIGGIERELYNFAICDNKTTESTCCCLEMSTRSIIVATDLILDLKSVCPVPIWRNGAIGAQNSILPRRSTHFYSRPIKRNVRSRFQY